MSANGEPGPALAPTYRHPLTATWSAPGGPWTAEALDEVLRGSTPVEDDVAAVTGGLAELGVEPGDAVAWQRPNGWEAVALARACWRLGAVAVPVHHLAGDAEVDRLLGRVRPAVFVGADDAVPRGSSIERSPAPVDPAAVAVALGTSGSSGTPKLVLHTHRALIHKVRTMADVHALGPDDAVLIPAPMAHISGLLNGVLIGAAGVRVIPMARWDPVEALAIIEHERVTFMVGPPTFFVSLTGAPGFAPDRVRSLRLISCGGAGVTPAFVADTAAALGCRVKRSYGSTEAPTVATSRGDDPAERAATTDGRAVGWAELRTVDAAGVPTATGEPGELQVRGPELFVGYDDPAATAAAFTPDGWFRTGDLATLDGDGWLTIVGRLKDVVIRGGENIATAAVEAVLEAHPAVRAAVVVGEPDERLGERVCAFVLADPTFDLAACRAWFEAQGATRFTWPERVEVLDELPLLGSGKPDRAALRARAAG